jgi:carboxymethylenebutenolidase
MTPKDSDLINRREAITLGVGFAAAAVTPATAWAISTPATGLEVADVKIPATTGVRDEIPAYVAVPAGKGPFPVAIVIHEIFGLHEYIRDVCRRLAKEGYFVVSPYLYAREGDATSIADIGELIKKIVSKVPQQQVLSDLDATLAWIGKDARAKTNEVALTGFCWGGNAVWMYAAHNPKVKAGVAWYGRLVGEMSPNSPRFPVDVAPSLTVPVLGLYAEKDANIPLTDVNKMRVEVEKGKSRSKIIVYPGTDHGFHADYRPSYNADAARLGWDEMLTWFKKNGAGA